MTKMLAIGSALTGIASATFKKAMLTVMLVTAAVTIIVTSLMFMAYSLIT